jgi:hypothetical protein
MNIRWLALLPLLTCCPLAVAAADDAGASQPLSHEDRCKRLCGLRPVV